MVLSFVYICVAIGDPVIKRGMEESHQPVKKEQKGQTYQVIGNDSVLPEISVIT
jgi:hypothetical protein